VSGKASLHVAREEAVAQLGMQKASAGQVHVLSAIELRQGQAAFSDSQVLMTDQECQDLLESWVLGQVSP
jgi:hypothetical protein